jgi:predicted Zn-dependent protease
MSKRLDTIEAMIAKGNRDPFVLYARAMELRSLGRLDEALEAFSRVEAEHPGYVPTYLMAAQTALEAGDAAKARAYAERGVDRARAAGDGHALSELEAFRARID